MSIDSYYSRFLETLGRTERLALPELMHWQWLQVARIVTHAARHVPFYGNRLRSVLGSSGFDPTRWHDVPLADRIELQASGEALWAREVPTEAGAVGASETSGSTGTPLRFGWNELASTSTRMQLERFWDWHGIDPRGRFAEIRANVSREAPQTDRIWSFRGQAGRYAGLPVSTPLERQLDWLAAGAPDYLLTYPTHAAALAEAAGGRIAGLKAVMTVGEMLSEEARTKIVRGFSGAAACRVLDTYGCQEAGKLALACPQGRYHVCAENVLLEIVDDAGAPVPAGGEGWVVITSLYNFATPFIRYRLGDRAEAGAGPCPCGRTLPVIGRILGRARNLLHLPDGDRRWPSSRWVMAMQPFVRFRQFQVVQLETDLIELRYVPQLEAGPPDEAGLAEYVRASLHPAMRIRLASVDRIERNPGGKLEDFISLVGRAIPRR